MCGDATALQETKKAAAGSGRPADYLKDYFAGLVHSSTQPFTVWYQSWLFWGLSTQ